MKLDNKTTFNNISNLYPMVSAETFHKLDNILNRNNKMLFSAFSSFPYESLLSNTAELLRKCRPYYMDAFEHCKPYILQQVEWTEKITKSIDLQKLSLNINKLANPLVDISRMWINNYNDVFEKIRETLKDLQHIPEFDFSKVDKQFKEACLIMLKNGYYPTRRIGIRMAKITTITNEKQLNLFICSEIDKIIKRDKNRIIEYLKKYKKIVKEIFELYENGDYRLCILSIINLLSIIYNSNFDNTDFTEIQLRDKLKNLGLLDDAQTKYSIFAPYYVEKFDNKILSNHKNKKEKYKKVPYCRNAILHGYSTRFGNRRNALRWFSVLLNTIDLLEAVEEKTQLNNK